MRAFKFESIRGVMLAGYKAKKCEKTFLVLFLGWFLLQVKIMTRDWQLAL